MLLQKNFFWLFWDFKSYRKKQALSHSSLSLWNFKMIPIFESYKYDKKN